jgi:hypothetical protein
LGQRIMLKRAYFLVYIVALSVTIPLFAGHASATSMVSGGNYQLQDHSNENHSNQTLDGIDLSYGTLSGSNLRDSSLIGGVFVGTDFSDANLRNTNLTGADLTNSIFGPGVNLRDANLTNAILIGVDLTGIKVQNAVFIGATFDATTILTFDPIAARMLGVPEPSPLTLVLLGLVAMTGLESGRSLRPTRVTC